MNTQHTQVETVDCTPTWEMLLPALLELVRKNLHNEKRKDIEKEFAKMAKAADKWNEHVKPIANGQRVHVFGYGFGTVAGYVDNGKAIRVEFESGKVIDFHPEKLRSKLVTK